MPPKGLGLLLSQPPSSVTSLEFRLHMCLKLTANMHLLLGVGALHDASNVSVAIGNECSTVSSDTMDTAAL